MWPATKSGSPGHSGLEGLSHAADPFRLRPLASMLLRTLLVELWASEGSVMPVSLTWVEDWGSVWMGRSAGRRDAERGARARDFVEMG